MKTEFRELIQFNSIFKYLSTEKTSKNPRNSTQLLIKTFGRKQIRGMSQTDFWKARSIADFRIFGHDGDRYPENSSKKRILARETDRFLPEIF